jgi:replicative superfamily II helicase
MIVNKDSLEQVDSQWAVKAIGDAQRDYGLKLADTLLVKQAVGQQIEINIIQNQKDNDLLQRLAMAYEIAAIEGLNAFINSNLDEQELYKQCVAGAWRAFEFRRLFDLPEKEEERIFFILHLSALAYCGDRWSDLRRWYNENQTEIFIPSVTDVTWDRRLLYRIFECWICLFRKKSWEDLNNISEIIIDLRRDQGIYESSVLNNGSNVKDSSMALRLISLYHWAKSTELLARYMLQGEPAGIISLLDKHFESGKDAAATSGDAQLEVLLQWLHAASRQMVGGSIWWVARAVNSRATKFVAEITKQQAMFELLPPQRAALQEEGLLDQAATAIVINMPTSGGKTLLAQFRILQALNQFDKEHGWVAYVAPTRALTSQITRRLRRDFEPIGINVEQLTGAVEIDTFEEDLLTKLDEKTQFDVLVATPEKLQLIIRNKKVGRPLALVVMDEAHNIEDKNRGLRIELLLATIKNECNSANFLLLMPYVENAKKLAHWLAQDINAGRSISLGTTAWKPNERIVGMYRVEEDNSIKAGWRLKYQTLVTTPDTIQLQGIHNVGGVKPLNFSKSKVINTKTNEQKGLALQTAGMAKVFSERGTSIAIATNIDSVWNMARQISNSFEAFSPLPNEIKLVQNFLKTEISPDFELIEMLSKGVGVHNSGLSDEVRALIEWLAENSKLRVLCATTTIAQGINFPVSSVFLASRFIPQGSKSEEMPPRDFWNLAGRAGRMNHDSVGVIGLASGTNPEKIIEYVSRATGELVSRLVNMLDEIEESGNLNELELIIQKEEWDDFRCYIAHLWNEKKNLDGVLADTEQLLRNTYGYDILRSSSNGRAKAERLLEVTKNYARKLANNRGSIEFADMTGFSPEGVQKALIGLNNLEKKLTLSDLTPESLFGQKSSMAELYGVMLRIPQLAGSLKELSGQGLQNERIAEITNAWVSGKSIQEIALSYFKTDRTNETEAITKACKAIYRNLVNTGTWGLSALSKLSGLDFGSLSEAERRRINILPAMIYHGVQSEEAVLMRMNAVPRSIAEKLGEEFRINMNKKTDEEINVHKARQFLKNLGIGDWDRISHEGTHLSGLEYKTVWGLLSGEER